MVQWYLGPISPEFYIFGVLVLKALCSQCSQCPKCLGPYISEFLWFQTAMHQGSVVSRELYLKGPCCQGPLFLSYWFTRVPCFQGPMFPSAYEPSVLYSHGPILSSAASMFPKFYVLTYLGSRWNFVGKEPTTIPKILCFQIPIFPVSYVPKVLCS